MQRVKLYSRGGSSPLRQRRTVTCTIAGVLQPARIPHLSKKDTENCLQRQTGMQEQLQFVLALSGRNSSTLAQNEDSRSSSLASQSGSGVSPGK